MEQSSIGEPTYRGTPRVRPIFIPYSEELALDVCEQIALGKSMRVICEQDGMPDARSVYRWLSDHPEFGIQYAKAKEDCADAFADSIVEIADAPVDRDDKGRLDSGHVQKQRLMVDARKWIASKLKPKSYGDKLDVAHSGNVTITRTDFIERPPIEGQLASVAPHQLLSDKSNGS